MGMYHQFQTCGPYSLHSNSRIEAPVKQDLMRTILFKRNKRLKF